MNTQKNPVKLFAILLFWCLSGFSLADNNDGGPALSAWTSQHLNKVNVYLAEENYPAALEKLTNLLESVEGDTYETAMTHQAFAYAYALQNKYPKAITHFEKALTGLAASENQMQKTRFDLAQLYVAEEQYQKAINILNTWLKHSEEPSAQAHILLGNAYAQLEQSNKSIPHVTKAIQLNENPVESWYQLLLALYMDTENYRSSVKLLPQMIQLFPETDTYWKQLGAVHLQLRQFKQGAAAMEIAWQRGLLVTETELIRLANLFLHVDVPEKAARLLANVLKSKQIKNNKKHWRMLGNAWLAAREIPKAIEAFTKAAALSGNGNLYEQVAQLHVDQENWRQAKQALTQAFKKGDLKHPGNCYLLLGIAENELGETTNANRSFQKATEYKESKKSASQWLAFLEKS